MAVTRVDVLTGAGSGGGLGDVASCTASPYRLVDREVSYALLGAHLKSQSPNTGSVRVTSFARLPSNAVF